MGLIGRDAELDLAASVLSGALDTGESLVFVGAPGIGKSALLEEIAVVARQRGLVTVRLAGIESEQSLPWAGLTQLESLWRDVPRDERYSIRELVIGAPAQRVAHFLELLEALEHAARGKRLALVVDDLQWLDAESTAAMHFLVRRLASTAVVLIGARRDDPIAPYPREHALGPLSAFDADAVLRKLRPMANPTRRALVDSLHGNPLALREVGKSLTEAQCEGRAPLPDPLPTTDALERSLTARLDQLGAETRAALLQLAISGAVPPSDLLEAEAAGVVSITDAARFLHPLMRSVVYWAASPAQRRLAHTHAALVAPTALARALHEAEATVGTNPNVAARLRVAAAAAAAGGASRSASAAFARAAEVEPDPALAADALVWAADAAVDGGDLGNAGLLLDAVPAGERASRAWRRVRTRLDLRVHDEPEALTRLLALVDDVAAEDPDDARRLLLDGAIRFIPAIDVAATTAVLQRLRLLPETHQPERALVQLVEASLEALTGDRGRAAAMLRCYDDALAVDEPPVTSICALGIATFGFLGVSDALDIAERMFALAAEHRAMGALPYLHLARALALYRSDAAGSVAAAVNAIEAADELSMPALAAGPLLTVVMVGAMVGDRDVVTRYSERLARGAAIGTPADANSRDSLAVVALLENRPQDALDLLVPLWEFEAGEFKSPTVFHHDLAEAAIKAGAFELADAVLERMRALDQIVGEAAWTKGVITRIEAMGMPVVDAGDRFQQSIDLLLEANLPFGAGRTALLWGQALRRARRAAAAREALRRARDLFQQVGATKWAECAQRELVAAGDADAASEEPVANRVLSPQQLEVARWIANGASYRDIASRLFISPRTVEAHASAIYRRLLVKNRAELAARAASDPTLLSNPTE